MVPDPATPRSDGEPTEPACVSTPVRECRHPRARHVHGTRAAYVKDRCRCPACTAANTAASRTTRRQQAYGRWQPHVDSAPVRRHITTLRAAGLTISDIATRAELSPSCVRQLAGTAAGTQTGAGRVRAETAERVLALTA